MAEFYPLSRRAFLGSLASLAPAAMAWGVQNIPFSRQVVLEEARRLAASPFAAPPQVPDALSTLDYDVYRQIQFRRDAAVWGQAPTKFAVEFFVPGYLYDTPVEIFIVESGEARPVKAERDAFVTPSEPIAQALDQIASLAGFRLHFPLNYGEREEFLVFQGASYFRAVSRGQLYGLSARGLALDVAEPGGEEFPMFRRFWIERPSTRSDSIVVHALLDSESVAGAYRFGIYPGQPTAIEISATLFPRRALTHVGLGCLTSMFLHGPADPSAAPDYRPHVHDSLGLAMATGQGERIWRPVTNPRSLQVSAFMDEDPRGFGLIQRRRDFADFQDLEARYERRPSAWVVPAGRWGRGHIQLVEIPTPLETNDNIVAYWRPERALPPGEPARFGYTLTWPDDVAPGEGLARVERTARGQRIGAPRPQMKIDYDNPRRVPADALTIEASVSGGRLIETHVQDNAVTGGIRVFLTFEPGDVAFVEMRAALFHEGLPFGETWVHRWTAA